MDRDHRWDRVSAAYNLFTKSQGDKIPIHEIEHRLQQEYEEKNNNDQTIPALLIDDGGRIEDGDTVLLFNYRNDRMKEITQMLMGPSRSHGNNDSTNGNTNVNNNSDKTSNSLNRSGKDKIASQYESEDLHLHVLTMTQYDASFNLPVLFPFKVVADTLPVLISASGYSQYHCAETEKYAHVTFFFSGGEESPVLRESRELIPSPSVKTYDLAPSMSMDAVITALIRAIESGKYDFLLCNLAAPDMVAHTGVWDATVKACEAADKVIGRLVPAAMKHGYIVLITGDHGNAEEMLDEKGGIKTSHTTNRVPFICCGDEYDLEKKKDPLEAGKSGGLNDVAPTVLWLMGIQQPSAMSGQNLLQ